MKSKNKRIDKKSINPLQNCLRDNTDELLTYYLESEDTQNIRRHIEELIVVASVSTPAGELKKRLLDMLEDFPDQA